MSQPLTFSPSSVAAFALAVTSAASVAETLRVPSEYPTIQRAIDSSHSGDTILVAPGTYLESLTMQEEGSFTLQSEAGAESTIIDARGGYHVIVLDRPDSKNASYRISGFTIRGGHYSGVVAVGGRTDLEYNIVTANGPNDPKEYREGAIRLQGVAGSIRNNRVEGNFNIGIEVIDPHDVLVESNRVEDNHDSGIEVLGAYYAASSAQVVRNVVSGHGSNGMFFVGPLRLEAADNLIFHGRHDAYNAVQFHAYIKPIEGDFVNNTIGAAVGDLPLVNFGGLVHGLNFANNVLYTADGQPAINCDSRAQDHGVPRLHHNDAFATQGEPITGYCVRAFFRGEGNMSVDPNFDSEGGGNRWKLRADSPLIDAGDNTSVGRLRRDIRGVPRIVDGGHGAIVDMGAFELPQP